MKKHLATFPIADITSLLNGSKTVEVRFSRTKIPPFGIIDIGDIVYVKPPTKDIIGQFRVKKVINIQGLDKLDIDNLQKNYQKEIGSDPAGGEARENIWKDKLNAKYVTIIFISDFNQFLVSPLKMIKKDQRAWTVLD